MAFKLLRVALVTFVCTSLLASATELTPCPTAPVVISNETQSINGHDLVFTKTRCDSSTVSASNSRILARSTIDYCGVACFVDGAETCFTFDDTPINPSDCTTLANSLRASARTWTVGPGETMKAFFNTCGTLFTDNDDVNTIEFCDATWGFELAETNAACVSSSHPSQGGQCYQLNPDNTLEWNIIVAQAEIIASA